MVIEVEDFTSFSSFLTFLKNGWDKDSSTDILKYGLKTRILFKKSIASSPAPGYNLFKSDLGLGGNASKYSAALVSVT